MALRLPVLLLVVCGTIRDCVGDAGIAAWGKAHLPLLRRFLPDRHGVAGARRLTLHMNRIDPGLFSKAFPSWVREAWSDRPECVAIDGKTSRWQDFEMARLGVVGTPAPRGRLRSTLFRSSPPRARPGADEGKTNQRTATPARRDRWAEKDGLKGAIVAIDAIATHGDRRGDPRRRRRRSARGQSQPANPRAQIESLFATADPESLAIAVDLAKGHGPFAINLRCAATDKRSIELRRKQAG